MSEAQELLTNYEADDGYPTYEWIERFRALPAMTFSSHEAASFLVNDLPRIATTISCMSVEVADGKDDLLGRTDVKRVEYHTGGWSGAEDLIDAMLRQFWIEHFHTSWRRGGHFYFEVPQNMLIA